MTSQLLARIVAPLAIGSTAVSHQLCTSFGAAHWAIDCGLNAMGIATISLRPVSLHGAAQPV